LNKSKPKSKVKDEILLGVDYGSSRIGLAFGRKGLVEPLKVVSGKNDTVAINEISRVSLENRITKIVVGLPLTYDGKETLQSKEVRRFAKLLKIRLKKPIVFVDEYGSSKESVRSMLGLGVAKKARRTIDHYAAAVILKSYFDQKH
jgi:putative holliday junction resolvase